MRSRTWFSPPTTGTFPRSSWAAPRGKTTRHFLVAWTSDLQARLAKRYENVRPNEAVRARRALADRANAYRQQPFDVDSTVDLLDWLSGQLEPRRQRGGLRGTQAGEADVPRLRRGGGHAIPRDGHASRPTPADNGGRVRRRRHAHRRARLRDPGGLRVSWTTDEQRALEAAARGQDAAVAAAALAEIRRSLLDRLLNARARSSVVATTPAVEALLQRAMEAADREVELSTSAIDRAVETVP